MKRLVYLRSLLASGQFAAAVPDILHLVEGHYTQRLLVVG